MIFVTVMALHRFMDNLMPQLDTDGVDIFGVQIKRDNIVDPKTFIDEFGVKSKYIYNGKIALIVEHEYKSDKIAMAKYMVFKGCGAFVVGEDDIMGQISAQIPNHSGVVSDE